MCDATHLTVWAEPLPEGPISHGSGVPLWPPCDACPWPFGAVLCFCDQAGCFVLCRQCAEQLARQTAVATLLAAALRRLTTLI